VTPLRLIDPAAPEFTPAGCRSLHDLTRFIHEKIYEFMFQVGDRAQQRLRNTFELDADLPLSIRVFDLGGGTTADAAAGGKIAPPAITSPPFQALYQGLTDSRIDWRKPRAVSAAGFLSVVGSNLLGPPPDAASLASVSFAVLSDSYLNFSVKAGYHFSTVDALCDLRPNNNYVNFRFAGGGAGDERKRRRLKFLRSVLTPLDFQVHVRGDLLVARLEKLAPAELLPRLTELGRLLLCSRQLDMLMDSEQSPDYFSRAFLAGDYAKF